MCGIAGFLSRADAKPEPGAARARLEAAAAALAHRGPDAAGVRWLHDHGLGLAHRRLSILDLETRSDQPLLSHDGRFLLCYNGEVYNYRALRAELRERGARFNTEGDSEVVIEGVRAWGVEGFLSRAAGMFAFALYDLTDRRLSLARDRAGKKPLYYAEGPWGLVFASELAALWRLEPSTRALDPEGLEAWLRLKFTPSPLTLCSGVKKLPPAHWLELRDGKASVQRRYWSPLGRARPAGELVDLVDAALCTAAERRLVSDVPVCLFLSGGVDSSLVADTLGQAGQGLKAYCVGYEDLPAYNEFAYAKLAAERVGMAYAEVTLPSRQALSVLQDDSLVLDDPVSDWVWVPLHELSRRARADGFKVALVGEGSDEVFFGYDVMLKGLRQLERWQKPGWRALAKAGSAALAPVYRRAGRGHARYDLWRRAAAGEPVYQGSSSGFPRSQRDQVAGPRLKAAAPPDAAAAFVGRLYREYAEGAAVPSDLAGLVSYIEFNSKMTEVLLQRVDRVTMRHSLEARAPFLDHELVELAFSIPEAQKIPGRRLKSLLKEVARRRLPAEVVDRPKMGFSFPFKEWLRGPLAPAVADSFTGSRLFSDGWVEGSVARRLLAQHRRGLVDHAPRVWALYSLARWYDRWIAGPAR
ncbi:MAG: asparagine synthase (glutamine-hydrolyzing) [Elusimicrobia bacterium]|nr:asparagine synthase (glutamine-hydrolyzing) [Elusimicrobiota bacterium]